MIIRTNNSPEIIWAIILLCYDVPENRFLFHIPNFEDRFNDGNFRLLQNELVYLLPSDVDDRESVIAINVSKTKKDKKGTFTKSDEEKFG